MGEWMYRSTFSFTSALVGVEFSASRPDRFTPGERAPGTYWIGGWVGPRAGLDDMEKWKLLPLPGLELRPLGRPACSQSLYRLSYPGSHIITIIIQNKNYSVEFYLGGGFKPQGCHWLFFLMIIIVFLSPSRKKLHSSRLQSRYFLYPSLKCWPPFL
jgi:hypothetical protein